MTQLIPEKIVVIWHVVTGNQISDRNRAMNGIDSWTKAWYCPVLQMGDGGVLLSWLQMPLMGNAGLHSMRPRLSTPPGRIQMVKGLAHLPSLGMAIIHTKKDSSQLHKSCWHSHPRIFRNAFTPLRKENELGIVVLPWPGIKFFSFYEPQSSIAARAANLKNK